ncbi:putative transcription factor interactor and regulator C3H-WRC/GRF family [Helianthus annuus]|nr:putative transcription factor interactor and regulator C3H-WRC/GRF family [Helianthus annuus]
MDYFHHQHSSSSSQSPSLPLPLFSSETSSSKTSKDMMQGVSSYFSIGQWQELEVQALIFRHMLTGSPIPPQLLNLLLNSNHNLNYPRSNFPPLYQTGGGYWGRGGMDPEPGRCKRTDGKKWRCSRDVVAGHKYCERHIHRGRNRSRKPVEIPTPAPITTAITPVNTTALCGGVKPYTTMGGGGSGGGGGGVSVHSNFFDHLHLNQRMPNISENETKPSSGRVLRPFFDDWPRTVEEQEVLATSLSISVPGNVGSDFSLKLATGNNDGGQRGEEVNGDRERGGPLNWGMLWGGHHAGSMGGPLAEALRSSSVSNSSSPTSVLHQLQRGSSTTASETSYVST